MSAGMSAYRPVDRTAMRRAATPPATGTAMVSVRVDADFKAEVKAYAALHGVTLQDMVRDSLTAYMQRA